MRGALLETVVVGPVVEPAVRAEVPPGVHRAEQVVRIPGPAPAAVLLRREPRARQVPVQEARHDGVRDQGGHGTRADPVLPPPWVVRREQHGAGGHLGLEDRRHRLRPLREAGADPVELRGVHGGQLHHRGAHPGAGGEKLAAERLVEALDGVLGPAVGALERDTAVGDGRADLDDHTGVAGQHPGQGGPGGEDVAEVADLGDPPELLGGDLGEGGEDGGEGGVDPDVDRAECLLGQPGGRLHGLRVGDVRLDGDDLGGAGEPGLAFCGVQSGPTPGDQREAVPAGGEGRDAGAADAGTRPGDHDGAGRGFQIFHAPRLSPIRESKPVDLGVIAPGTRKPGTWKPGTRHRRPGGAARQTGRRCRGAVGPAPSAGLSGAPPAGAPLAAAPSGWSASRGRCSARPTTLPP